MWRLSRASCWLCYWHCWRDGGHDVAVAGISVAVRVFAIWPVDFGTKLEREIRSVANARPVLREQTRPDKALVQMLVPILLVDTE